MATLRPPRGSTNRQVIALRFADDTVWALDQTALPFMERELALRTAEDVAAAIRRLSIRGAPLIGVAAAYGVALAVRSDPAPGERRGGLRRPPQCAPDRRESGLGR